MQKGSGEEMLVKFLNPFDDKLFFMCNWYSQSVARTIKVEKIDFSLFIDFLIIWMYKNQINAAYCTCYAMGYYSNTVTKYQLYSSQTAS